MLRILWIATMSLMGFLLFSSCEKNPVKPDNDTLQDIDGNIYSTIKIGSQVWTAENLRTTKYNDGTAIALIIDNSAWVNDTTGAHCYYNNTTNEDTISKFGALYNWYAVQTNKLAPTGWHVSTAADWDILENYLIANGYNWDGSTTGNKVGKALSAKSDWASSATPGAIGNDLSKNNSTGFSALPGGSRGSNGCSGVGEFGYWWSSTESSDFMAWHRYAGCDFESLNTFNGHKNNGFSVRLVRD